jgi:HNH endonuclease
MILPEYKNIHVENLSSVFKSTTNSYKFYWFLVILENVKIGNNLIAIDDIILGMISEVWYPINYFKLSFGLQDKFNTSIQKIQNKLLIPKDIKKQDLLIELKKKKDFPEIRKLINNFSRWVPMRFIRSWYSSDLRGMKDQFVNERIIELTNKNYLNNENPSLYRFVKKNKIEINPIWLNYLKKHLSILKDFTYWNLNLYLQRRNPNVGNIPVKLLPPHKRELSNARRFWNLYFTINEDLRCIYSDEKINKTDYTIDHFLPWSFTGHDQLWNLLPIPKNVNSSKSDILPNMPYLKSFISLQYSAFHYVLSKVGNQVKLFEDYVLLFNKSVFEIKKLKKHDFIEKLMDSIKPQMQLAKNMGFQDGWEYKK